MPINGLGAHKPCPLALDCMKACNTARAAKGGLRERSGAKGGEGGEGRLMASPRAASIPVGGRGRSRTRTPPPPESGPTHPGTVAGRAARRAGGGRKGEGGTREDRARGGRGKRKSASIIRRPSRVRAVAEWAAGGPSEPAMLRSPSSCVPKAGCCSRRAPEEREGGAGPGRAGGLEQGTMNN